MSNEAKEYNVATIQQLLLAAFTPKTLRRFCRKHPTFRPILNEFSPDHGLSDMVDEVITYCETNLLIPELLAEVRRANPRQYARYAECLYAGQEPEPAGPVPPASPPAVRHGVVDRLKETLGQHRRPIRIGIISLLALVVLVLLAIVIMAIIESRRTPEDFTDQFRRTTSPDVRVTALASLMKQPGHEQDPQLLFFGELAPEEQVSMWQISDPDGLQEEYAAVVRAIYTHLDNSPQSHLILQAIAGTLLRLESPTPEAIRDLQLEVKWWLEGQNRYSQGEYREALSAYDIAVAVNRQNAATYFERALVHVGLEEHSSALLDLERVLRLDRARKEKVEDVIRDNASLFTYLGLHRADYPSIASSFPTLTPTPTSTPTPTLTPTMTATPSPSPTPTPTPTPSIRMTKPEGGGAETSRDTTVEWAPSNQPMTVQFYRAGQLIKKYERARSGEIGLEWAPPGQMEIKIWTVGDVNPSASVWVSVALPAACDEAKFVNPNGIRDVAPGPSLLQVVSKDTAIEWEPVDCVMDVAFYQFDVEVEKLFAVGSGEVDFAWATVNGQTEVKLWVPGSSSPADAMQISIE